MYLDLTSSIICGVSSTCMPFIEQGAEMQPGAPDVYLNTQDLFQ